MKPLTGADDPRLKNLSAAKRALLLRRMAHSGPAAVAGDGPFPTSFDQERLWLLDQVSEAGTYNVDRTLRVTGALDVARLEAAFAVLVERHEALRTSYNLDSDVVQRITAPSAVDVLAVDLREIASEPERERRATQLAREAASARFDLTSGNLLRVRVSRLADDEWRVVVVVHHLASDETAAAVLFTELAEVYGALGQGRAPELPTLSARYVDFAVWQRDQLRGPKLSGLLEYWTGHLGGAPAVLELPADRPRPAVSSGRGDRLQVPVDPALFARLDDFARQAGVTRFHVVLAAGCALLQRMSGLDDLVVGTPVAGRHLEGFERVAGCFTNTVALRVDCAGRPTGAEFVGRVRDVLVAAIEHQELPFQVLVDHLDAAHDLSVSPVFQVMIMQQDLRSAGSAGLPGLDVTVEEPATGTAKLDLLLRFAETPAGPVLGSEYSTDLFDRATIARWLRWYLELLDGLLADPGRPVDEIPVMSAAERAQLEAFGTGRLEPGDGRLVTSSLVDQARLRPAAPAVSDTERSYDYQTLERRSRDLARALLARGVGRGDLVGVYLDRTVDLVVTLHGIVRAGAAYVPLDPAYPVDRIRVIIDSARPKLVVTEQALVDDLSAMTVDAPVVLVDTDWPAIEAAPAVALPEPSAEDLAYVIFTSGSTGRPKGVRLPHRALANLMASLAVTPGLWAEDVMVGVTTPAFDLSVPDWFLPAWVGAHLVVVGAETALDADALGARLAGVAATVMDATPATWRLLIESGWSGSPDLRAWCGGEAWSDSLSGPLGARCGELWNMYGPTETCVWSAARRIEPGGAVRIGGPLRNTAVAVVDARLEPVPLGAPGELCIAGDGVALGYHGQPELTAERFTRAPERGSAGGPRERVGTVGTPSTPGTTWYRTGDVARWRADGTIEFLGRLDHQVKLRGFRIELGDVETALATHDSVAEALAQVVPGPAGEAELVAWITPADGASGPSPTTLRDHARATLPGYMVPATIVVLDAFPLTPNGKIDRSALARPTWELDDGHGRTIIGARTDSERIVAAIWRDVLGRERIDVETGFFDVGGNSLLAARVIARLRDASGVTVALRELFREPTVAALAARIDAAARVGRRDDAANGAGDRPGSIGPRHRTGPAPLSFGQERMWLLEQMAPANRAYNVARAFQLRGPFDVEGFGRALTRVQERHEILRTNYPLLDGAPVQTIQAIQTVLESGAPVHDVVDLSDVAVPEGDRGPERGVAAALASFAELGFDLVAGPVWRARVWHLGPADHVVCVVVHHIAFDGSSLGVLWRQLAEAYAAESTGHTPEWSEWSKRSGGSGPQLQYADYASWQRDQEATGAFAEGRARWKRRLAGAPTRLELPTDASRPPVQAFAGERLVHAYPAALSTGLAGLARANGASMYHVLVAAVSVLLHRWSGQTDLVLGTPVASRAHVELEELIGYFANTLALRVPVDGDMTFVELVARAREVVLDAFDDDTVPFEHVVSEVAPERDLSSSPIFQVLVVLQNMERSRFDVPGLDAVSLTVPRRWSQFDLSFSFHHHPTGLTMGLEYDTALFRHETVERMVCELGILFEAALADPTCPVGDLALLTPSERHLVLDAWQGAIVETPRIAVVDLVAATVARTPGAVAVEHAGSVLTYRELYERASLLARDLRTIGVGPGIPVGVTVNRSLALPVAVLGILMAGGGYAPIDPAYPVDRVATMLDDAAIGVVVTQPALAMGFHDRPITLVTLDDDGRLTSPSGRATAFVSATSSAAEAPGDGTGAGCDAGPDDLAYLIFTSGSTGRPKGVAMTNGPLVNLLTWQLRTWDEPSPARTLQFASLSFDVAFQELFATWAAGGTLVLVDEHTRLDPDALARFCDEQRIERLFVPFVALNTLAEAVRARGRRPETLREVITAGEALRVTPAIRWMFGSVGPSGATIALRNQYGPTESHVVTELELDGPPDDWPALPSIGRPVDNARILVLDPRGQPTPIGVVGELHIGGPVLARGYHGRPELTAERFLDDLFIGEGSRGRLYRTGDLARWLADGTIEFLGRIDHQVKIRGFRVELGEVEAALNSHPLVGAAVAMARDDDAGARTLVAYLTPHDAARRPTAGELRAHLSQSLPGYMVPSAFVVLDGFPLSPNGKVDRRRLPAPAVDDLRGGAPAPVAPRTPVEQQLHEIWVAVLGGFDPGVLDNFFEVGGDSIRAARMAARLRTDLGIELPLRAVFEQPTIAGLAERISSELMETDLLDISDKELAALLSELEEDKG